ncbi:PD-(D/E)XK nuclease family protein [Candidatus Bathyarchaeota archaeon]|nr:PD-(D/E)XK nuclease family protein [Candidatus Bathyarchaeota archaeon]
MMLNHSDAKPTKISSLRLANRPAARRLEGRPGIYHVTETIGCLRRSYLERRYGHEESYEQVWVNQRGRALHRQVTWAFQAWSELPIRMKIRQGGFNITLVGHIDAYDPDRATLIEFKSTCYVKWQNRNGMLPRRHHVKQVQSYFSIMTGVYRFPVETLLLAYMDDMTPPLSFQVEKRDLTDCLIERARELDNSLREGEVPLPEPSDLCHYCAFKEDCIPCGGYQ